MRFATVLLVAFACSGAFASELGQPLDCSDMQFTVPGLSCVVLAPMGQPDGPFYTTGSNSVVDNDGYTIIGRVFLGGGGNTVELLRSANGGQSFEVLARIASRWDQSSGDYVRFPGHEITQSETFTVLYHLMFDPVHGRLLVPLFSYCQAPCPESYGGGRWIAAIDGFTTLSLAKTPSALKLNGLRTA